MSRGNATWAAVLVTLHGAALSANPVLPIIPKVIRMAVARTGAGGYQKRSNNQFLFLSMFSLSLKLFYMLFSYMILKIDYLRIM